MSGSSSAGEATTSVEVVPFAKEAAAELAAPRHGCELLLAALARHQVALVDHCRGVARLSSATGRELGLSRAALTDVAYAAELHDVGKLAIPRAVLEKPGPLSAREWQLMRRLPLIGEEMLVVAPALRGAARLVRSAHERWDGRGYPDGLAGEQIPLGARIIFASDAYDAMISDRPYQPARVPRDAIAELGRYAGSQFDPLVVEALVATLEAPRAPFPSPHRGGGSRTAHPRAGLEELDRELLPFAVELAEYGPFLADELFLGAEQPLTDAARGAWLNSAVYRQLIVPVDDDPTLATEYTVGRQRCELRLRAIRGVGRRVRR